MVELLIFEATCPYGKKEIQLILNRVTEKNLQGDLYGNLKLIG